MFGVEGDSDNPIRFQNKINYALHLDAGTTSVFSLWCSGVGRKGNTRDASIY